MHKYHAKVHDAEGDLVAIVNLSDLQGLSYYVGRGWTVTVSLNHENDNSGTYVSDVARYPG